MSIPSILYSGGPFISRVDVRRDGPGEGDRDCIREPDGIFRRERLATGRQVEGEEGGDGERDRTRDLTL